MEKDRGFRVIAIIAILVSIAGLTVGFASLSQTLNIRNTTTLKGTEWSVVFAELKTPKQTGEATATAVLDTDSTLMTITADLKKPGDKVEFEFDVTNDGGINAKLSAVPVFAGETAEATAANIKYDLKYSDGNALAVDDTLDVGSSRHLILTIEFDEAATEVVSTDTTFDLTLALLYIQN